MANKQAKGKGSQLEKSLLSKLHEMLPTDTKVYFIVWKYAPHLLPKKVDTFEELTAS